jgi:hypothetical protein
MEIVTGLRMNSLFWFSSLHPHEQGITRRILEDLLPWFDRISLLHREFVPQTAAAFEDALDTLVEACCVYGMLPIIHLDMHGTKEEGLLIAASGERVTWNRVVEKFRAMNVGAGNNLLVLSAACFGLHAIREVKIHEPCPFFMLIAPEGEIEAGFLEEHIFPFYRTLLSDMDAVKAYEEHLKPEFTLFHCEKVLAISLAKYIRNHCKGKGAVGRKERLLSEILMQGIERTPQNLRKFRQSLKKSDPTGSDTC